VLGAGERADDAARLAGLSCGVAGHVRDLAFFSARRRCRIPLTWLSAVGLNAEDVFGAQETRLEPALDGMKAKAKRALSELNAARFPRAATAALAPATLSRWSLRRAFDPARPGAMPAWQRVARLAAANFSWRF